MRYEAYNDEFVENVQPSWLEPSSIAVLGGGTYPLTVAYLGDGKEKPWKWKIQRAEFCPHCPGSKRYFSVASGRTSSKDHAIKAARIVANGPTHPAFDTRNHAYERDPR